MEADYLIAYPGGETAEVLVESLIDKGNSLLILSPEDRSKKKHKNVQHIGWNPKSPLSAKNALLSLVNSFDVIPPAVFVFPDFEQTGMSSHQLSYAQIDSGLDNALRGMMFLIKELLYTNKQRSGSLSLCLPRLTQPSNAFASMLHNAVKVLGEGLFEEYAESGLSLFGFENRYDDINKFADFVLHQLPQLSKKHEGKWNIGGERGIFFSNLKK